MAMSRLATMGVLALLAYAAAARAEQTVSDGAPITPDPVSRTAGDWAIAVPAPLDDPAVIRRILTHLGFSMDPGEARPAVRASPSAQDA